MRSTLIIFPLLGILLLCTALTSGASDILASTPREEVPNPQMERHDWISLNGRWAFDYGDDLNQEREIGTLRKAPLTKEIIVPFAPETIKSGIGNAEFDPKNDIVWYRRMVELPNDWNRKALLHFGAVDYEAEVFVDGKLVATHLGGYAPFSVDVTPYIQKDSFELMVRAYDPATSPRISRGKQELRRNEGGIYYDKSTGIRESVWIEKIGDSYLKRLSFNPRTEGTLEINSEIKNVKAGLKLRVLVKKNNKVVAQAETVVDEKNELVSITVPNMKLWSPETPHLYDLEMTLENSEGIEDHVYSYTGFKDLQKKDGKIYLNGKRLVQKLVLDQGYYPKSGYTAPSVDEMERDILLAKEAGFNGARFHQQTANAYKRYLADKHGYLYWVEMPSARNFESSGDKDQFIKEAVELFKSVRNSVGFVTATGFNETWALWEMNAEEKAQVQIQLARAIYPELPPNVFYSANDGWEQISVVDENGKVIEELNDLRPRLILALHDYPEKGQVLRERYGSLGISPAAGTNIPRNGGEGQPAFLPGYGFDPEVPVFLTEYGGVTTYFKSGKLPDYLFGYHLVERDQDHALARIMDQFNAVMDVEFFTGGSCYTQIRDTKYETNGILQEDGTPKFPLEKMSKGLNE